MKVYVVEQSFPYEGGSAVAVFSTETLAEEYCEAQRLTHIGDWDALEFEVDNPQI